MPSTILQPQRILGLRLKGTTRGLVTAGLLALLATVAADHLFGRHGDDWSRYDHRAVAISAILAGDAVGLADGTPVRLIGVADPTPEATDWLRRSTVGRRATLLLPTVGTRDGDGRLLAYLYVDGTTCLNVEIVREGLAYADRRAADVMAGLIDAAENEARRKGRGLWDGLRFDQMPPWRQAWLRAKTTAH